MLLIIFFLFSLATILIFSYALTRKGEDGRMAKIKKKDFGIKRK